jgi:hypothetical protein
MVMLYVETDYQCWARYAASRELDSEVRGFLSGNSSMLAHQGAPMDMQVEPTERGWEMVSTLRKNCRFPGDLSMEVYAGIIGKEAAITFMRWLSDREGRPLTAHEVLNQWTRVAPQAAEQRDDVQAATISDLITTLQLAPQLGPLQEEHLVAYIDILPRDLRFGFVKSLLRIPAVALAISQDKHDAIIYEAIQAIGTEAANS